MVEVSERYLDGDWQFVRIIENVRAGIIGEVWGQAQFIDDGEGLTCLENGVLRFNGHDYHTGRTSLWRFGDAVCRSLTFEIRSTLNWWVGIKRVMLG